ncbi:unnamed protein product [Rotaria sp. Silwood2]|nr:unnamed protein product [Rotaria sp. Silwood2]CAF3350315.1 unnamed protein product [Rotaria sp. Silwood2]CAF4039577.1 unnamed protein product [Rotaria sp. Silwood2]CAF4216433.1 unnamed protein product [Rotaria sp. Silwood2]
MNLFKLIEDQKITIIKQLEPITKEIRSLREENVIETDIDRLGKKINEMRQKLKEFTQKDANESIIVSDEQIDWSRLIYIRQERQQKYRISTRTGYCLSYMDDDVQRDLTSELFQWSCRRCTYLNDELSRICEICSLDKGT